MSGRNPRRTARANGNTQFASALTCPACGTAGPCGVADSRGNATAAYVRRRRRCGACGHAFTTYEVIAADPPDPAAVPVARVRALLADAEGFAEALRAAAGKGRAAG